MHTPRYFAILLVFTAFFSVRTAHAIDDRFDLFGDLRVRNEAGWEKSTDRQIRTRMRARIGVKSAINDDITVAMRFATGSPDPSSANQTMTGGFSSKDARLDLMYAEWNQPNGAPVSVTAGKMPNPLFRAGGNQAIWDSDLSPEGFSVNYISATKGAAPFFATANAFWVTESATGKDVVLVAAQAGPKFPVGDSGYFIVGGGFYHFSNPFFGFDWRFREAFAQVVVGPKERNLTVYGNFAKNFGEDTDNTLWIGGIQIHDGKWSYDYAYRQSGALATPQYFASTKIPLGETNAAGHVVSVSVAPLEKVTLKLTAEYFDTMNGASHSVSRVKFDATFAL